MRPYLLIALLLVSLRAYAQPRIEVVTDSAALSFMQWRLRALQTELGGETRLNMFIYTLHWPSMPWRLGGHRTAAGIDTLIQQHLGLIHGADTAAYAEAISKCRPLQDRRIRRAKPLFTAQDLLAIARSFDEQPGLVWPAAFPGFRLKRKPLPACCAFTQPIFCANGQIALQWEYVFGEEGLAVYRRLAAHEWCLLSQPQRIMY